MRFEDEQTLAWDAAYAAVIAAGGTAVTAATLANTCVNDYKANPDMDRFHSWYTSYSAHLSSYAYPQGNLPAVSAAALAAGNKAIVDYETIFVINHNRRTG